MSNNVRGPFTKDAHSYKTQAPSQMPKNGWKKQYSFHKKKNNDSYHASFPRSRRPLSNQTHSFYKGKSPMYNRWRDWNDQKYFSKSNPFRINSWKRNIWKNHASTSRGPQISCYYCGIIDHMKVDYRKEINDLKYKAQHNKKYQNDRRARKKEQLLKD